MHKAQEPVQEIGPSTAQTSDKQNNGQTPPTTAMETNTAHTHMRAEQVASPTDQPTQGTSAHQDRSATDSNTAHASQPTHTTTKEIMTVDSDEQHKPPLMPQETTQEAKDKETQTKIHQADAAVQTDSLHQA